MPDDRDFKAGMSSDSGPAGLGERVQDVRRRDEAAAASRRRKVGGCEHALCDCAETSVQRDGRRFCGDRCADLETSGPAEMKCSCGHPGCVPP